MLHAIDMLINHYINVQWHPLTSIIHVWYEYGYPVPTRHNAKPGWRAVRSLDYLKGMSTAWGFDSPNCPNLTLTYLISQTPRKLFPTCLSLTDGQNQSRWRRSHDFQMATFQATGSRHRQAEPPLFTWTVRTERQRKRGHSQFGHQQWRTYQPSPMVVITHGGTPKSPQMVINPIYDWISTWSNF